MNAALIKSKLNACWYIMKGLGKPSFSQSGEDRILHYLFLSVGISKPTYLDIGANQPVLGSNSYFFYHRGAKGVCIEPEPGLYRKFKKARQRDICLNIGIGFTEQDHADFFVFDNEEHSGWNTFSQQEAETRKEEGHNYHVMQIPLKNVNKIIEEYFQSPPDMISIDVEGLDFDIIRSLDFEKHAPLVFVVETIRFGDSLKVSKQQDIIDYIIAKGYTVYADTFINTIFLKSGS